MATVFMASGDQRSVAMFTSPAGITPSTSYPRTGSYGFEITDTPNAVASVPARADYYFKAGVTCSKLYSVYRPNISFREGSTQHITLKLDFSTGTISVIRGPDTGTVLAVAGGVLRGFGVIECIEVYVKIDNSAGSVILKVNGEIVATFSGDTQNSGTTTIDNVWFFPGHNSTSADLFIDDVRIDNADWCGQGGIYVLSPTGAGDDADWSASAGNPYECVDDIPPIFDDYISADAGTPNAKHNLAVEDMSGDFDNIACVGVVAFAKLSGAGAGSLRTYADSNGTDDTGDSSGLTEAEKLVGHYMTLNPDDSAAWEKADVDAIFAGVETI